jgi:thiol-disulfide isomerase/thioredoxin
MKKQLLIAVFSVFSSLLIAQTSGKAAYTISGTLKGYKDTVCYLGYHYGDKQYIKDTTKIDSKGNFTFKGNEKLDGGIYLIVSPEKRYFEIIVPSDNQNISFETDSADFVMKMKVKNSTENELFYQYLQYINPKGREAEMLKSELEIVKEDSVKSKSVKDRISALDKDVVAYKKDFIEKHPKTFVASMFKAMQEIDVPEAPLKADGSIDSTFKYFYYKDHFFDNIDFTDDKLIRSPIYHAKLKQFFETVVVQIPDSINREADKLIEKARANKEMFKYTVWFITNTFEKSKIMGMDAVFVHMGKNYYMKGQAYWIDSTTLAKITERVQKTEPNLIGKIAPELKVKDSLMRDVYLSKIKAEYTIIYFYAPTCGHCKKVTPVMMEMYKKMKAKSVEVLALCTEYDWEEWKKYLQENKPQWINTIDITNTSNFRNNYDIYSTPVIYLLDKDKKIIAKRIGAEQIEDIIEKDIERKRKNNN